MAVKGVEAVALAGQDCFDGVEGLSVVGPFAHRDEPLRTVP
jgi:hypothetical protein